MSEAEYKIMKEQLRQELLAELQTARPGPLPWHTVRKAFDARTRYLNAQQRYALNAAFCTLIRYRYDLKSVTRMTPEQAEDAKSTVVQFLALCKPATLPDVKIKCERKATDWYCTHWMPLPEPPKEK